MVFKNGTYANSGNPVTGTNAIFSGITAGEKMALLQDHLMELLILILDKDLLHTPPTGYKALSTNNLLNHTICYKSKKTFWNFNLHW